MKEEVKFVAWFSELSNKDVSIGGGKGASLAEMYNHKFPIPPGFIITAQAYRYFLEKAKIVEIIENLLENLDVEDTKVLEDTASKVRDIIVNAKMPEEMEKSIIEAYDILDIDKPNSIQTNKNALDILKNSHEPPFVAVRSSATTEDLADASFAGQQDSFLNVNGEKDLIEKTKRCFASLFNARAVYYRTKKGFDHTKANLAVVVQKMINSEKSGVMFSKNPVADNSNIVIEAVFGLGEGIVSGMIKPDHYEVSDHEYKTLEASVSEKKVAIIRDSSGKNKTIKLTEEKSNSQVLNSFEIRELAIFSKKLESHYKKPQDIEFAITDHEIFIVQSRPVTVFAKKTESNIAGDSILTGLGASPGVSSGIVRIVHELSELDKVKKGDVLVTVMTNPDMVVSMQKAAAIVTDEGGVTSHAAIVSREMGIPCFSGDTIIITNTGFISLAEIDKKIKEDQEIYTLSLNKSSLKTEWKRILNSSKRKGKTISFSTSKNGKIDWNILKTTPEHKFFSFEKGTPYYKEIKKILDDDKLVYIARQIPIFKKEKIHFDKKKAYLAGAIFSDGYLRIQKDGTSNTVFVQKAARHKKAFIKQVCKIFKEVYSYKLRLVNSDYYYCYKKDITQDLLEIYSNLEKYILNCSLDSIKYYFAALIDGDGNFIKRGRCIKVSIDAKDIPLLKSLILGCLRLGFNYRVKKENNEFRFYITSGFDKLKPYLKRIKIPSSIKSTGDTYFSANQFFSHRIVPGRKGIKSFVKNNCLISEREILEKIIPYVESEDKKNLLELVNSDIGALRIKRLEREELEDVFNIEVKDNNNYIVFTKFFTPIVVKNCVVGTGKATSTLKEGEIITVDGSAGKVYEGKGETKTIEINPAVPTNLHLKVIVDIPEFAERAAKSGILAVGLVRLEGIIAESGKHPLYFAKKKDMNPYFDIIFKGLKKLSEPFKEIWVRTSDLRSDEFEHLEGAPHEKEGNPMLGDHGVRFSLKHKDIMTTEVKALIELARVHPDKIFGIMVPQVISLSEVQETKKIAQEIGILPNVKIGIMVETPAAVQIIEDICKEGINFISFGTNDLTQYTLAIDRNNSEVQSLFNEMNPAVLSSLRYVIRKCKKYKIETSICGQAGSKEEMVKFLLAEGIDSISVNADAAEKVSKLIAQVESQRQDSN
ncbi:MAG: PEP/pyruvate-binding domain-containing protein [Nanoarchaeota archaeon]